MKEFETLTQIPSHEISFDKNFLEYGIDSYTAFHFVSKIKKFIPDIPITILLECQNIAQLAEYLVNNYPKEVGIYLNAK